MVHLLKMLCEIKKKNSITFSKILVIVPYVCRVNRRTLRKSYYRSLSLQSWFYSFKKDNSRHFKLLYSRFRKATGVWELTLSGTLIDTCITPYQENNLCNRKGPRNCQMSEKGIPMQNTHDLFVGTLSIGIPSCIPNTVYSPNVAISQRTTPKDQLY